jgi:thioredoxin 1
MAASRICLFLAVALLAVLIVPVACSQSEESGWVGTTPLEEALTNEKPTVAEFGASTCVPCKAMKPILEELVAEHGDKFNLAFIDVYQRRDLSNQYKITAIPTQVFFDSSGKEVTRHVGFWSKENIVAQLQEMGVL